MDRLVISGLLGVLFGVALATFLKLMWKKPIALLANPIIGVAIAMFCRWVKVPVDAGQWSVLDPPYFWALTLCGAFATFIATLLFIRNVPVTMSDE
jgi:hypothetical protein